MHTSPLVYSRDFKKTKALNRFNQLTGNIAELLLKKNGVGHSAYGDYIWSVQALLENPRYFHCFCQRVGKGLIADEQGS